LTVGQKTKTKKMKNYKLAIAAVALAITAAAPSAQATLNQEASGSGDLVFGSTSTIDVSYDVVFDSSTSLYTYLYSFTPIPGDNIGQFTINAMYVNSVLTAGTPVAGSPYTLIGSITDSGTSFGNVSWVWNPYTANEQLVGFTSLFGPTAGAGSLNDDTTGPWGDNPSSGGTPITVPGSAVPEPSTFLVAASMLLPLGFGTVRTLRKARLA
jgi:hypothetical protein